MNFTKAPSTETREQRDVIVCFWPKIGVCQLDMIITRLGEAEAVLQTDLLLNNYLVTSIMVFLQNLANSHISTYCLHYWFASYSNVKCGV